MAMHSDTATATAANPAAGAPRGAFAKANLRLEVPDSAAVNGMHEGFEARFAKALLGSRDLGVCLQRLAPRTASPFAHRHREQPEELYVVVAGTGTVVTDGVGHPLIAWDAVRIDGPVARHFVAGPDGLDLLAFGRIHPQDGELLDLDGNAFQGDA